MGGTEIELLTKAIDTIQKMGEAINLNNDAIMEIELFLQALAELSFKAVEIGKNNYDALLGLATQISDELELIKLMNDAQAELIEAITQLAYFNTGLGVFNTVLIFVIGIILIRRK